MDLHITRQRPLSVAWHMPDPLLMMLSCLQYYDESRKELAAAQDTAATVTVGGADPKTPIAKTAVAAQPITAGPTPMTN